MKSITTCASSSPQSSCRKWPPPAIVVWRWPSRAGNALLQRRVAAARHRIAVAERGEEGLLEALESLPRGAVRGAPRDRRARSAPAAGTGARPPCSDSSGNGASYAAISAGESSACGRALEDPAGRELGHALRELAPGQEGIARRGVAGRQEGVRGDDACEALGRLAGDAQAEQAAPVLADQRDAAQIERLDRGAQPLDVTLIRVVAALARLVGAAEADEIRRDDAVSRRGEERNHLAIQIRPRRLAVQAEHRIGARWALRRRSGRAGAAVTGGDLDVVRGERVAGQVGEALIGGAEDLQGDSFGYSGGGSTLDEQRGAFDARRLRAGPASPASARTSTASRGCRAASSITTPTTTRCCCARCRRASVARSISAAARAPSRDGLAARADHVLGIDLAPEMLRVARESSGGFANLDFEERDFSEWEASARALRRDRVDRDARTTCRSPRRSRSCATRCAPAACCSCSIWCATRRCATWRPARSPCPRTSRCMSRRRERCVIRRRVRALWREHGRSDHYAVSRRSARGLRRRRARRRARAASSAVALLADLAEARLTQVARGFSPAAR